MVLLEFSIYPLGKGESVSSYVARCLPIIESSGLDYQTHAMGTILEGEYDQVMDVVRQCFEGSHSERVPWTPWVRVLSRWFLLFAALFLCILGMLCFFRRHWVDGDWSFGTALRPARVNQNSNAGAHTFARDLRIMQKHILPNCLAPLIIQVTMDAGAAILTTAIDSACGYAAFTLMPVGSSVLSIEFKINFLSPALGDKFICTGRVVRAGQTVTVCSGEVMAVAGGEQKLVALMQATMMRVDARND